MKELIKEFPEKSGIYKITSPSGKIYIGEANNLKLRCTCYLNENRIKGQRKILNSLKKYGIEKHFIEIVEFCDTHMLFERERFWQEYFNSVENGLNCHYTATQTKKKLHSIETKQIMSERAKGNNNHFFGKKHTELSLKKISERSKGCNNPNFGGKNITEEFLIKQKISNSKKPLKVIDLNNGSEKTFLNSKDVAEFYGVKPNSVRMAKKHGYLILRRYKVLDIV